MIRSVFASQAPDIFLIQGVDELIPGCPEKAFILASALGPAGTGVKQRDSQDIENTPGLVGDKGRTIIRIQRPDESVGLEDMLDALFELQGAFGEGEVSVKNPAGGVLKYEDINAVTENSINTPDQAEDV